MIKPLDQISKRLYQLKESSILLYLKDLEDVKKLAKSSGVELVKSNGVDFLKERDFVKLLVERINDENNKETLKHLTQNYELVTGDYYIKTLEGRVGKFPWPVNSTQRINYYLLDKKKIIIGKDSCKISDIRYGCWLTKEELAKLLLINSSYINSYFTPIILNMYRKKYGKLPDLNIKKGGGGRKPRQTLICLNKALLEYVPIAYELKKEYNNNVSRKSRLNKKPIKSRPVIKKISLKIKTLSTVEYKTQNINPPKIPGLISSLTLKEYLSNKYPRKKDFLRNSLTKIIRRAHIPRELIKILRSKGMDYIYIPEGEIDFFERALLEYWRKQERRRIKENKRIIKRLQEEEEESKKGEDAKLGIRSPSLKKLLLRE